MNGETEWTLHKIRQAYGEILEHYNILFAPQPPGKKREKRYRMRLILMEMTFIGRHFSGK